MRSRHFSLVLAAFGLAEALEKVDLRARVQGFLGPRLFKDGDEVKEAQVVFTIEKEPFETAVEQRKAQLAAAQATLAKADQQLQRTTKRQERQCPGRPARPAHGGARLGRSRGPGGRGEPQHRGAREVNRNAPTCL